MRNPFKRKPLPDVPLTNPAFARWLRAHSPQPLSFFLGLGEAEQETLAGLGEEYDEDGYVALAYAISNPEAAALGAIGDDEDELGIEESLVQRMAATMAARAQGAQEAPGSSPAGTPPTMGGITKRRTAANLEAKREQGRGRRLMGREPDDPAGIADPVGSAPKPPEFEYLRVSPHIDNHPPERASLDPT